MKKMKSLAALLLVFIMAISVIGCGSAESGGTTASSASTSKSASESTAKSGGLRVALLLPGSLNDGGWNAAAYNGLMELKNKGYDCAFTESVAVTDIEQGFRNYASEGYELVIGHGAEFGEPAMRVAPEFPDTHFFVSGKVPDGVAESDIPSIWSFRFFCCWIL